MTSEAKGVRESADEIPYDHEVWARLIRKNQALAMNVHVDDMLDIAQAANQSGTQYYVAPDVEEACALRVADTQRLNRFDEVQVLLFGRPFKAESSAEIEKTERRRVERLFDASTAVVALAFRDNEHGLSPFWRELDALRREGEKEKWYQRFLKKAPRG